ncbi:hypothetical protein [Streptomyces sp. NPDC018347]
MRDSPPAMLARAQWELHRLARQLEPAPGKPALMRILDQNGL